MPLELLSDAEHGASPARESIDRDAVELLAT
jgi:hypothetical protein